MRLKFIIVLIVGTFSANAQDILWEKSYGGRQADLLFDVIATPDYGFILAGSSFSGQTGNKLAEGHGNLDYCIWKMDEKGIQEWQKSFGGTGNDLLKSIQATRDGGFILGGTSNSDISAQYGQMENKTERCRGGNDYWVVKLNAHGQEIWQKTIGGTGQDDLIAVIPSRDGGYLLCGSSNSGVGGDKTSKSNGNLDYWIVKLNDAGKMEWQKSFGGKYADILRSVTATADGGYILGGSSNSPQGNDKSTQNYGKGSDYWIIKINKTGDMEWQQTIGGEGNDQLFAIHQTHDKGYIVGGNSDSGANGSKSKGSKNGIDFWVLKLDTDGFTQWQETYDFGAADMLTSIVENDDHTYLIGGHAKAVSGKSKDQDGINDYIVLKISEKGESLWEYTVGSDGQDILRKAIETRDGGYLLAGTSNPEFRRDMTDAKGSASSKRKPSVSVGSDENLAIADDIQNAIDDAVNAVADQVNGFVDDKINAVTNSINDGIRKATGQKEDSRLKFGVNAPVGKLMDLTKGGGGSGSGLDSAQEMLDKKGPKKGLYTSRSKQVNYGDKDFWVVKLGEKDKLSKEREMLQAAPNPVIQYTNVIIGFEYEKGTLSVFDISGRRLQHFTISDRTVPVNLSGCPDGIYIVKVSTNKGEGSVKLIKSN